MSRLSAEIESAFRDGAAILTANLRAARWLQQEYALEKKREGRQAWITPFISDWDSWIRHLWQSASALENDPPMLLTDLQERQVWLRMLREDANLLVSPDGMAQLAASAYALLCEYEAPPDRDRLWEQADAARFQQWATAFERECQRQNWIARARLESRIAAQISDHRIALPKQLLPKQLLFIGFDRFTPAQESLLNALRARDVEVITAQEQPVAQPELIRADDLEQELTLCAWWTRRLLDNASEGIRIGIVMPDAASVRGKVNRIFRRVLLPESNDVAAPTARMPFEFSLGQPLASVPVIKAALLLLRWVNSPLREEEVSWLLLSGFFTASSAEWLAASRFDAAQRNAGSLSLEIELVSTRRHMSPEKWPALRHLQERLLQIEKFATANHFSDQRREPGQWVDLIQSLLQQSGWASSRSADSVQFQARTKWERALEDVALLDFDARIVLFPDFLHVLASHCEETLFAAESLGAPVQIMGALEASGQRFDALWFLGADDASWPLRGNMHPLLPYDLQRNRRMPHAASEVDFALSLSTTKHLFASAPTVIVSHAARNKDGDLRPSPLIALVAESSEWIAASERGSAWSISDETSTATDLEEISDASGVIPWPRERSAGGSEVLAQQAACPFQAFAAKRLAAREWNRNDWGLDAATRGNLLHKVLERIWSPAFGHLHTLEDLHAAQQENRIRDLVKDSVQEVFAKEIGDVADEASWLQAYLASEQRTLCRRIEEWLNEEAKRVPFTVIACEEKLRDVHVGELKLNLRADRIDEVADYARLLIDYKTGRELSVADWNPPRPSQPQLPLYAAFGNVEDVRGVLFARLRAGETCFVGKVANAKTQLFGGVKNTSSLVKYPYSEADRDKWSEALIHLAEQFLQGEAAVDPKDGANTCEHCPLPGLCRVAEFPDALTSDDAESFDD